MFYSCSRVRRIFTHLTVGLAFIASLGFSLVRGETLEVVNYNIEADINGDTTPLPGLDSVLEAIGTQTVDNIAQPIDILALEETTSNSVTVAPIVTDLNSFYGAGTYAMADFQGGQNGSAASGNGPNAMIYNTTAVSLVSAVGVSGTGISGDPRQVVRYEFEPVGGTSANVFYVYVSHMKSSFGASGKTETQDEAERNTEALAIRADEATLPATASVLYVGDFNLNGTAEAAYQTLTASGHGQAIDPLDPTGATQSWNSATFKNILTESSTSLSFRDDIQFMSSNVYNGTSASGLQYVMGSYRAFGNDGSTAFGGSVDKSTNTALNDVPGTAASRLAILDDLTTASDHLPLVADYTINVIPEPGDDLLLGGGLALLGVCAWLFSWLSDKKDGRTI